MQIGLKPMEVTNLATEQRKTHLLLTCLPTASDRVSEYLKVRKRYLGGAKCFVPMHHQLTPFLLTSPT